jgi:energy-coupling factor transporter ATP-binding protein EcfA2
MQLRLGFSLASHLEPDVLLVDEAVSVGDAGFQHRCLERMRDLVKSGITLLFVSHVPSLVAAVCKTGILLARGRQTLIAPVADVVSGYLDLVKRHEVATPAEGDGFHIRSWSWEFRPSAGRFLGDLLVRVEVDPTKPITNPRFGVGLSDGRPGNLVACSMVADHFQTGELSEPVTLSCEIRELPLKPGAYTVWISCMNDTAVSYLIEPRCLGYVMLQNGESSDMALEAGTSGFGAVGAPYAWGVTRRA